MQIILEMTTTTLCTTNIIRINSHNGIRKQKFGIKCIKENMKQITIYEKKKITITNTATT